MQITTVTKDKKDKNKLSVYIDNQFSFNIREEDYISLGLYSKTDITQDEIDNIKTTLIEKYAKNSAIKYLALKLRTENDVVLKLESEGFDQNTIEKTTSELKAMGYINDRIYAQKYIYDRNKLKPKSRKMLFYELQNKRVPKDIIESVIDECGSDDFSIAANLIRKRFGKYDLNEDVVFKRAYSFLLHRGFDCDVIFNVIKEVQNEKRG